MILLAILFGIVCFIVSALLAIGAGHLIHSTLGAGLEKMGFNIGDELDIGIGLISLLLALILFSAELFVSGYAAYVIVMNEKWDAASFIIAMVCMMFLLFSVGFGSYFMGRRYSIDVPRKLFFGKP